MIQDETPHNEFQTPVADRHHPAALQNARATKRQP
jgi:hypothetical protein